MGTGAVLKTDWFSGILRDGCGVSPSCFACPLPDCQPSKSGPAVNHRRAAGHAEQLRALLAQGYTVADAGRELGISRRQAYRLRGMLAIWLSAAPGEVS